MEWALRCGGSIADGSGVKLLFTAVHHPSILVTRFFLRFNASVELDLVEPPDDWRGRSSTLERLGFGDILWSTFDRFERIERLRRLNGRDPECEACEVCEVCEVKSSRDVTGVSVRSL